MAAWIGLTLAPQACSSTGGSRVGAPTRVVVDDLGRQVRVVQHPERLVSLAPSTTEMLFALGAGDRVVGVTTYCDYPPEAKSRPKIGDTIRPNLERILGTRPDLVVASRVSQLENFARRLESFGIPLFVVDARRLEDIPRSIGRLGVLLGRRNQAENMSREIEQRMTEIGQTVQGKSKVKVMLVVQREPLMVAGTKSYLADLIHRAGGIAIGPEDEREGVVYSLESAIAQNPEIVVIPEEGSQTRRMEGFNWPKLSHMAAIRDGKVYSLDANLIFRPGPRLLDGLLALAQVLHPEAFPQ